MQDTLSYGTSLPQAEAVILGPVMTLLNKSGPTGARAGWTFPSGREPEPEGEQKPPGSAPSLIRTSIQRGAGK